MKKLHSVTHIEVLNLIKELHNNDELSMKHLYDINLLLLVEIRDLLKKADKKINKNNIVTDPLKAKQNDIVIG